MIKVHDVIDVIHYHQPGRKSNERSHQNHREPTKRRDRPTHSSAQTVEPLIQRHADIEEEERKSLTPFNYTHIFHVIYIGFSHLESPIQYCVTPKFIAAVIVFV